MINQESVKWLQVEATTRCNAWCSQCGRSKGGFSLDPNIILQDLDTDHYRQILQNFPNLETVDFCGTYGDAIAAKNINDLVGITKKHANKIIIRTNGSLRDSLWWRNFAELLKDHDHEIWFCLDGLDGVHEIYRQATSFNTIISNAKSFMSHGGTAVWQFIPWKHNQHQIKDCIRLSQKLGFKRFEFIKNVRSEYIPHDYRTGKVVELMPWDRDSSMNKYKKIKTKVEKKDCQHLTQQSYYINASGKISNCCYFNQSRASDTIDDLPNIEEEIKQHAHRTCIHSCGS